jgi:glycosyltransferase involved in cell wall biosynthesis
VTRIGVSGFFVHSGRVGGAEQMVYNLMRGLASVADQDEVTFFSGEPIDEGSRFYPVRYTVLPRRRVGNRFLEDVLFLRRFGRHFDSILFPNYFTPPMRSSARLVSVIHDLQYRHFPENFTRKKRVWLRGAHAITLRRADAVVAISQFVKEDLLRHHGDHLESKVHVIPNPISWERFETPCAEGGAGRITDDPYVLSVAAHYAHKNLETLIRAFAMVRRGKPEIKLVLAGQLPDSLIGTARHSGAKAVIRELGLDESVLITGHVSDAVLGVLYRGASVFVFPSLFEGFGMPPVEALGMGLPVVTTRCACLPAVTMGLATYVDDPLDPVELAERITTILNNPSASRPAPRGIQKLREVYAPQNVAREYRSLLT